MVSRGGRSRGCTNCRRRRVKCDEARPGCNRCKTRGLICDGPKEATWINESRPPPSKGSDTSTSPSESLSTTSQISTDLVFSSLEDDAVIIYLRKQILRTGPVDSACIKVLSTSCTSDDPGMALLRSALLSLSTIFYGKQHKQHKIYTQGYQMYGRVLARLNRHLAQARFQTSNETILTVLTCNLLEVFLPTGTNNFLKHIRGLETILAVRGPPEGPLSDEDHLIFVGLRLLLIAGGIVMSTPTIYSKERWKALPGKLDGDHGMLRRSIMNVLADCTCLMSTHRAYLHGDIGVYQILVKETKVQYERLQILYSQWVNMNRDEGGSVTLAPGNIQFANKDFAATYMLYHSTVICLMNLLSSLEPSQRYYSLRKRSAVKISKCLEQRQYEKDDVDAEGNTIGLIAVRLSWQVLGGFATPEGRKLSRSVKCVVDEIYAVGAWEDDPMGCPKLAPPPERVVRADDVTP